MSVFSTQSLLTIILRTNYDVTTASIKRILYEKPSGIKGYWDATVDSTTRLKYDVQIGDIDEVGWWEFQSYVEIGGLSGPGDVVKKKFEKTLL